MTEPLVYRVDEAATAIRISRAKTYSLIAKGEIPSVKIGGSIRVPVDALRDYINKQHKPQVHESAA